jgi:hypothetical protein
MGVYYYMDFKEMGWISVDWINLAQDREELSGFCDCGD